MITSADFTTNNSIHVRKSLIPVPAKEPEAGDRLVVDLNGNGKVDPGEPFLSLTSAELKRLANGGEVVRARDHQLKVGEEPGCSGIGCLAPCCRKLEQADLAVDLRKNEALVYSPSSYTDPEGTWMLWDPPTHSYKSWDELRELQDQALMSPGALAGGVAYYPDTGLPMNPDFATDAQRGIISQFH